MTISQIISIGRISQFLAAIDGYKNKYLHGVNSDGGDLPRLLYMVRRSVEYMYNQNPAHPSMRATANYLYALCGRYALQAQYLQGNAGGVLQPTLALATIYTPVRIQFAIPDSYPSINEATPVSADTTDLRIADEGIQPASLEVLLDSKPLNIGIAAEVSYTFTYLSNILTITFNQGLATDQVLTIRYVKATTN